MLKNSWSENVFWKISRKTSKMECNFCEVIGLTLLHHRYTHGNFLKVYRTFFLRNTCDKVLLSLRKWTDFSISLYYLPSIYQEVNRFRNLWLAYCLQSLHPPTWVVSKKASDFKDDWVKKSSGNGIIQKLRNANLLNINIL